MKVDQSQLASAQKNVDGLIRGFNGLQRAATFALTALGVGKAIGLADEYLTLENKLKAVTNSTEEFVSAQKGVEQIAQSLKVPVTDVADSFLRYQLATESLGRSQEEVLDFTKRVTQAMILSGATSQEAHRAAVQLAQGFGKNFKAAAQDLKSVKEQAPVLARIIERAAGGVPGSLLVMAKAGKITSKLVFDAVRAEGEKLDADFAKRQKTFGNILFDLLGNKWLDLIKKLRPAVTWIIDRLEKVVDWIGKWIEDGSAINSVVAGLVVIVGSLAYAFSGLALALTPVLLAFLGIEDFVGFLRGDESVIGDLFEKFVGKNQAERFRAQLDQLTEHLKQFFQAMGSGPEAEMAAWRFERAMKNAIDRVWAYAREQLLAFARREAGVNPVGPQKQSAEDTANFRKEHPIVNWIADVTGFKDDIRAARARGGIDPDTGRPLGAAGGGMVGDEPIAPAPWVPPAEVPRFRSPFSNPYQSPVVAAPVVTNNITVQGNADASVAREIGTQAGRGTAEALGGRDRSAVGAGFGVAP